MKKRILHMDFPDGIKTVFLDGKRYTYKDFELALKREKRRSKNGRFSHSENS